MQLKKEMCSIFSVLLLDLYAFPPETAGLKCKSFLTMGIQHLLEKQMRLALSALRHVCFTRVKSLFQLTLLPVEGEF